MAEAHLHYEVHDGGGPPALFVHGMFAGRGLWRDNVEPLQTVCSPVVVELYGHGRSPTPSDPAAYSPASYVAEFDRIRAAVGAEKWWLVGHSLGAALTLRYSLDRPARTAGQVFTNSMSGLGDEDWQTQMATDAEKFAAQIERAGAEGIRVNRVNPAHSHRVTDRVREALLADEALLDPTGIANAVRSTTATASVRSRIGAIRVPTLLIAGERERAFVPHRDYVAHANPAVIIENLPCGHSPNAERPDDYNRLVTSFLRGAGRGLTASRRRQGAVNAHRGRIRCRMLTTGSRFVITHAGSLPRPAALAALHGRRSRGEPVDAGGAASRRSTRRPPTSSPRRSTVGIDVGNDGEQARESFFTYVQHRMTGFGGASHRPAVPRPARAPRLPRARRCPRPSGPKVNLMAAPGGDRRGDLPRHRPSSTPSARSSPRAPFAETFMTARVAGDRRVGDGEPALPVARGVRAGGRRRAAHRVPDDRRSGPAPADRRPRPRPGAPHAVRRPAARRVPRVGRAGRRRHQRRPRRHRSVTRPPARVLGQLRGPAHPRRRPAPTSCRCSTGRRSARS